MTSKYFAAFITGAALMFLALFTSGAFASDMHWRACGVHAGRYFCTEYIGIPKRKPTTQWPCERCSYSDNGESYVAVNGCPNDKNCRAMICRLDGNRETDCIDVPLPRA